MDRTRRGHRLGRFLAKIICHCSTLDSVQRSFSVSTFQLMCNCFRASTSNRPKEPVQRLWVTWGQCSPRVAASPCLPNGPKTQLGPYLTRNPCRLGDQCPNAYKGGGVQKFCRHNQLETPNEDRCFWMHETTKGWEKKIWGCPLLNRSVVD